MAERELDKGLGALRFAVVGALVVILLTLATTNAQPSSALAMVRGIGISGVLIGVLTQALPTLLPSVGLISILFATAATGLGLLVTDGTSDSPIRLGAWSYPIGIWIAAEFLAVFLTPRALNSVDLLARLNRVKGESEVVANVAGYVLGAAVFVAVVSYFAYAFLGKSRRSNQTLLFLEELLLVVLGPSYEMSSEAAEPKASRKGRFADGCLEGYGSCSGLPPAYLH